MADGTHRPSSELTRTTSNSEVDTSAPFENVKAARSIFETGGEKSKIPMPSTARSGSTKSGDWLSKQQGFVSPRSRANSFEEKQRAATVVSPNSATSEYRGYVSPPVGQGDKLEAELKAAQAQLEEAQTRATALQAASNDEDAKRSSLERKLAEYQNTTQQLEEKLAREQADHSAAKAGAEEEMKKLQAALEKSQADHEDKTRQVAAALTALQTTADAHSSTQDELAAMNDELAAVKAQVAEAQSEVRTHQEALAAAEKQAAEALASVHVARQAEEVARREAAVAVEAEGRARAEVATAQSEVELSKKTNATLESRLEAAAKELDLAKHAEELATKRAAEEQAAREQDRAEATTVPGLESRASDAAIYAEELSRFQGRLAETEALADKRVAAATAQLEASKLAEEEAKAKHDALLAESAAAQSAESSLQTKLDAALADAEQARKALQAESDKVHISGVSISIAKAKEKEAVEKLAVIQHEKEALERELSELRKTNFAHKNTSSAENGEHKGSRTSVAEIQQENTESPTVAGKPLPMQQEPAKPLPQQEPAKTKSEPNCCVVM